ncbi:MAG: hypothetical protein DWG79_01415 [Chloroflexi bacterium]|nr:hypothetical protein [Chloroflexota bacterium]MQC82514.1 hypothetical protein [Chloroflexota bacterium]
MYLFYADESGRSDGNNGYFVVAMVAVPVENWRNLQKQTVAAAGPILASSGDAKLHATALRALGFRELEGTPLPPDYLGYSSVPGWLLQWTIDGLMQVLSADRVMILAKAFDAASLKSRYERRALSPYVVG